MNKHSIFSGVLICFMFLSTSQAQASTRIFNIDWSGVSFGNSASAHGVLTVDNALFPAASFLTFLSPGVEILDFSLAVTGSGAGDGVFQLNDFAAFTWATSINNGLPAVALDLTQQLVGQPSYGGGWGTSHDGSTGDFNVFANSASNAPTLNGFFTFATENGAGLNLELVSFVAQVPMPASGILWFLGTVFTVCLGLDKKRSEITAA